MIESNTIVLDLEIQDAIVNPEDWDNTDKMKISCCVIYSYLEDRYHVFGPSDVERLRNYLITVDCIVGYNLNKFDIPIIFGMPNREFPHGLKTYDILVEIWKALGLSTTEFTKSHRGYSLDKIAGYTLGKHKIGKGVNAPFWFKQGDIWKVIDYCISDVALTKELYEYIVRNGFVAITSHGQTLKLKEI